MNDQDSIVVLAEAIKQAGTYTPGQQAKVHFKGIFHADDTEFIHPRPRNIKVTLSAEDTERLVQEASFHPIIRTYGLDADDIEWIEIDEITVEFV
jgi:hypothetical protein